MAFEILTPDVGTRLLRTFGAISEENRKRKEQELSTEKAMQNIMLKDAALQIREQGQQLTAVKNAHSYEVAMARLQQAQTIEERRAIESDLKMKVQQFGLDAQAEDVESASEAANLLGTPDEEGKTLHQRMRSEDPKEAEAAMNAFVGAAGRLYGKGKLTNGVFDAVRKSFNDRMKQLETQKSGELAAKREDRMQKTADTNAAIAERRITDQELRTGIIESQGNRRLTDTEKRTGIMQSEAERKRQAAFSGGAGRGKGEHFAGGSGKVKVPGFGTQSMDQIREMLAQGGEVAAKLKIAMKSISGGTDAEGGQLPSVWDDVALDQMERQGKEILQEKARGVKPATTTPSGVSVEPLAQPGDLDSIFERAGSPAQQQQAAPAAADPGLGILPPLGAATPPAQDFFGLPRSVVMA